MGGMPKGFDKRKHVELLKRFEIDKFLGKGSFGACVLAWTRILHMCVTLDACLFLSGSVYRVKKIDDGQVNLRLNLAESRQPCTLTPTGQPNTCKTLHHPIYASQPDL